MKNYSNVYDTVLYLQSFQQLKNKRIKLDGILCSENRKEKKLKAFTKSDL